MGPYMGAVWQGLRGLKAGQKREPNPIGRVGCNVSLKAPVSLGSSAMNWDRAVGEWKQLKKQVKEWENTL